MATNKNLQNAFYASNDRDFAKFVDALRKLCVNKVTADCKDEDMAKEVFSLSAEKLLRKFRNGDFAKNGITKAYVVRTVRTVFIDMTRKERTFSADEMAATSDSWDDAPVKSAKKRKPAVVRMGDDALGILKFADLYDEEDNSEEILSMIRAEVEALSPKLRTAILSHFSGMKAREIAEESGESINTILGRIKLAKDRIFLNVRRRCVACGIL